MMRFDRKTLLAGLVATTTLGALSLSSAEAAMLVEVKVISVTAGSFTDKTASIAEGESVTVGIYLTNINDVAGGENGLGSFSASVRSFGETYNVPGSPTAFVNPSSTTTVLNATAFAANAAGLGAGFDTGVGGSLLDINAISGNPDPNDTDIDARAITASQATGGTANTIGVGVSQTVLLGTATFTALNLDDSLFALQRTVNLNTFFTTSAAPNGGLNIRGLSSNDPATSAPGNTNLATAGIIGTSVAVTVVPEPATLGLLGLGAALMVGGRRRRTR